MTTEGPREEWYASTDEYDWSFVEGPYPSREAAIAGGPDEELEPGGRYYVGRKVPFVPRIDAETVLERLTDAAWDHAREHAGDWPNPTRAQVADLQRRLDAALSGWIEDHGMEPTFYAIDDITEHAWGGER